MLHLCQNSACVNCHLKNKGSHNINFSFCTRVVHTINVRKRNVEWSTCFKMPSYPSVMWFFNISVCQIDISLVILIWERNTLSYWFLMNNHRHALKTKQERLTYSRGSEGLLANCGYTVMIWCLLGCFKFNKFHILFFCVGGILEWKKEIKSQQCSKW